MPEQIGLADQLAGAFGAVGQLGEDLDPLPPGGAVRGQRAGDGRTGEAIQHPALLGGPQQPQLVVLPVHGEQPVREVGEHPGRHRAPTQVRPRASVGDHRAAGDEAAVLVGARPGLGGELDGGGTRRRMEPALDHGAGGTAAHPGDVGTTTTEQVQPGDHHRLARPGLPGDHGEPGVQVERGLVDHTEALDAHLGEHTAHPSVPALEILLEIRVAAPARASPAPAARTCARVDR